MATISSSALTIIDMTDQNQLSAYLTSNFSTIQTCTSNGTVYNPDWSGTTPLKIKLHAFVNQTEITNFADYTITWYAQDGNNDKTIIDGQNNNELMIATNELGNSESGMLTYWCCVKRNDDPGVNFVESQITYTLIVEAKTVVFSVYAPDGNVFVNQNGELTLATHKYYGSNKITSGATFQWYRYENTNWVTISGATQDTLPVSGSDVINIASYKCVMTYNSVEYVGVITLQDKSDPYVSEIYTIGGNIFKNGVGGSAVYVIVRLNGQEVDELKGPISATAPSSPVDGDYWYQIDDTNDQIIQKRYSGGAWNNYTIDTDFIYTWSLMDKDGNDIAFQGSEQTKTGKVIYISCNDITGTGTLQCDITQEE